MYCITSSCGMLADFLSRLSLATARMWSTFADTFTAEAKVCMYVSSTRAVMSGSPGPCPALRPYGLCKSDFLARVVVEVLALVEIVAFFGVGVLDLLGGSDLDLPGDGDRDLLGDGVIDLREWRGCPSGLSSPKSSPESSPSLPSPSSCLSLCFP